MSENVGSIIERLSGTIPRSHWGGTAVRVPPSREVGGTVDGSARVPLRAPAVSRCVSEMPSRRDRGTEDGRRKVSEEG